MPRQEKASKKISVNKVPICNLGWDKNHLTTFVDHQRQRQEALRLEYCDPAMMLCIYTDASDKHLATVIMPCKHGKLSKPIADQIYFRLAFLSSAFSYHDEYWSTYERTANTVIQALSRLDKLLACDGTTCVLTDHRNVLFVYNTVSLELFLG